MAAIVDRMAQMGAVQGREQNGCEMQEGSLVERDRSWFLHPSGTALKRIDSMAGRRMGLDTLGMLYVQSSLLDLLRALMHHPWLLTCIPHAIVWMTAC